MAEENSKSQRNTLLCNVKFDSVGPAASGGLATRAERFMGGGSFGWRRSGSPPAGPSADPAHHGAAGPFWKNRGSRGRTKKHDPADCSAGPHSIRGDVGFWVPCLGAGAKRELQPRCQGCHFATPTVSIFQSTTYMPIWPAYLWPVARGVAPGPHWVGDGVVLAQPVCPAATRVEPTPGAAGYMMAVGPRKRVRPGRVFHMLGIRQRFNPPGRKPPCPRSLA